MKKQWIYATGLFSALALSSALVAQQFDRQPAPEDAEVYIIAPQDGDVVDETFTVRFGLKGMGVAPAGIEMANTGHHHLLVNMENLPDTGMPLGDNVMHFGGGQTETELTLEPGEHSLRLVLGDYLHIPHDPPLVSEEITVTVE